MNRTKIISKLTKKLSNVSGDLKKQYSPNLLKKYLRVEKELQIQQAYKQYEENGSD